MRYNATVSGGRRARHSVRNTLPEATPFPRALRALLAAAVLASCTGDVTTGARDGGEPGADAGGDAAPPCPDTLGERLSVTPVSGVAGDGPLFAAPVAGGGVVIASHSGSSLTLVEVDQGGQSVGAPVTVSGSEVHGLAVHDDAWAILFARGSDELVLRSVDSSGAERFETRLLGDVSHDVTENEWFGSMIRDGRLTWTGTQWAAYYTVQRLWSDGVAHYGDQLQLVDDSGAPAGMIWDWGCSHSMEIRLTHNGTALGPVCISDCYPVPGGVHFAHDTFIYSDDAGNCGGGYGDHLGGVVPASGAFWIGFSSSDDRPAHHGAVVRVTDDRQVGAITWLNQGSGIDGLHIGPYGSGLIAGWAEDGADRFRLVDASGELLGEEAVLEGTAIAAASDLFEYENGDVGWVTRGASGVSLVRVRACD